MTANPNTLQPKPDYSLHRRIIKEEFNPAVITADSSNLSTLFTAKSRGAIDCKGWTTVSVLVVIEGGAGPTVDLQPLEHARTDAAFSGPADEGFIVLASTIAGISSGDVNEVVVDQGKLFLRLDAVAGGPDEIRMYVMGKERAISITGQS